MRSVPRAAQDLYVIASPESPVRALLVSIAQQLRLSLPPAGIASSSVPTQVALPSVNTAAQQLQVMMGRLPTAESQPVPGHEIDVRYQQLLAFIGEGPGSPMDQMLKSLLDIQQVMAKLAAAPVGTAPPTFAAGDNPATALQTESAQLPQPVSRWLSTIAASGAALLGGNPRGQLAAVFNAAGGPAQVCPGAIRGIYPFERESAHDISLQEFSQLLGPGGLIDGFVNTLLRPYIDMSGASWRPQAADGVAAPVTPTDLTQFQRAATIRDAFFTAGSATPSIRFDVTPVSVDRATRQAILDIDGADITDSHDPPRPTQITWPGSGDTSIAKLQFDPPLPGQPEGLHETGPWAMFRLFGHGKLKSGTSPDHYTLIFESSGREAVFDLKAGPGPNPFTPGLLQDFRCPTVSGS
jgi:type VI secretion system protein ImpL